MLIDVGKPGDASYFLGSFDGSRGPALVHSDPSVDGKNLVVHQDTKGQKAVQHTHFLFHRLVS
jgi:hypothetical protein